MRKICILLFTVLLTSSAFASLECLEKFEDFNGGYKKSYFEMSSWGIRSEFKTNTVGQAKEIINLFLKKSVGCKQSEYRVTAVNCTEDILEGAFGTSSMCAASLEDMGVFFINNDGQNTISILHRSWD